MLFLIIMLVICISIVMKYGFLIRCLVVFDGFGYSVLSISALEPRVTVMVCSL